MNGDEFSAKQDEITYRRVAAWELKRMSDELEDLKERAGRRPAMAWMLPAMFAALLTGAIGYVGIVHQIVLRHSTKIDIVSEIQQRNMHVIGEMEELKRRMIQSEMSGQQLPYLSKQVNDMNTKLDRFLERYPR